MIYLVKITNENCNDAFNLKLASGQEKFVSNPVRSLAQAYVCRNHCQPFGIYNGETMIGYVCVNYDYNIHEYDIRHMMIDESQQGKGYGSAAMDCVLDYIRKKPFGPCSRIALTCNKENTHALHLFEYKGFTETGAMKDAEIELVKEEA